MATTGKDRTAAYRQRKGLVRVELQLSPVTKEELFKLYQQHGNNWDTTIQSLLGNAKAVTGDNKPLSGKAKAEQLLAVTGDASAALVAMTQELQQQYPDWTPNASKHKKGTTYYEPQKQYNSVSKALQLLSPVTTQQD